MATRSAGAGVATSVVAARTPAVPWDVPVRLVAMPAVPADQQVRRVDLGATVPGVAAVDVVTVRADPGDGGVGHDLLTDVRPVRDGRAHDVGTLTDLLAGLVVDGAVPVAVDGTPFVRDVLAALGRVPLGACRTYAGLAADAGHPRAVRAVASVMARNRVPLVLPCHRVVPSSGGTGRYGWGETVKAALLALEAGA